MTTSLTTPHPRPTTPRTPPECLRLAKALVETMLGCRPLHSVRKIVNERAYHQLTRYRLAGIFSRSDTAGWRCKMPTPTAAEISVRISTTERWRVCVLRMDYDERWKCTELVVLGA